MVKKCSVQPVPHRHPSGLCQVFVLVAQKMVAMAVVVAVAVPAAHPTAAVAVTDKLGSGPA